MALRFGKQEEVECIVDVALKGKNDEALCLAHKTTTYWLAGGVYLRDDGYVVRPRNVKGAFYELTPAEIALQQSEGTLPTPLPGYSISRGEYVMGYSLWWAIGIGSIWTIGAARLRARRSAKRALEIATTEIDHGAPTIRTKTDQFVADLVVRHLVGHERVVDQAYTLDRDTSDGGLVQAMAHYVVLTTDRIFLFRARIGAFGPLRECRNIEILPRSAVTKVLTLDDAIFLTLADGTERALHVTSTRALSNQKRFLQNVPRLLTNAS